MDKSNYRSLLAIPIILIVATGIAFAGSQGGYKAFGFPVYAICVALAFLIQWIAFIPAFIRQTESFFDLTGSISYITVLAAAVVLSPAADSRSWLLAIVISVWALRLGTFLYRRIRAAGEDKRFRDIKRSFPRFLLTWTIQGLWVAFSLAAALAAITTQLRLKLDSLALIGFAVWLLGFGIEVIADWQKSEFKSKSENSGKFINVGLWSWSRHPNYFGEIVLWIGIALIAFPVLRGWQYLTLISPIFIFLLLTRISGVPMLEALADKKWAGQQDYEAYKARTSVLIPRPPR